MYQNNKTAIVGLGDAYSVPWAKYIVDALNKPQGKDTLGKFTATWDTGQNCAVVLLGEPAVCVCPTLKDAKQIAAALNAFNQPHPAI